ncbi:MAG: NAD(P)/FAD-dependent oxidoreductase [Longimicrobiales bacterium]
MIDPQEIDVVVVGGGPAGLACALWLGRYRRTVRVYDTGEPRNRPAWAVHGFPGIADPPPLELRALIRQQALDAGADLCVAEVVSINGKKDAWVVCDADGAVIHARRVVLAYGLRDFVPDVPGIRDYYGHSVYHCPDCDGPGVAGMQIGVLGNDRHAVALALFLLTWSPHVTLLTNGETLAISKQTAAQLADNGIGVNDGSIEALRGDGGRLQEIFLGDGIVAMDAIFFHLGSEPRCELASSIGCGVDDDGYISVDNGQQTTVPGSYAAGDISGHPHLAIVAAAEGVRAALSIHRSLLPDRFLVNH